MTLRCRLFGHNYASITNSRARNVCLRCGNSIVLTQRAYDVTINDAGSEHIED